MAYVPGPNDTYPVSVPTATTVSPGELATAAQASDGLNVSSLVFDDHSGCVLLRALLSWNYSSLLSRESFWYERTSSTYVAAEGSLPKGNAFKTIELVISDDTTANLVGEPIPVTQMDLPRPTDKATHKHLIDKVFGLAGSRVNASVNWVDKQSSATSNHYNNYFIPTNPDNGWREVLTTEFASLSKNGTPHTLIRTNLDFFKCGQNPALVGDSAKKHEKSDQNMAAEYVLTSAFEIPKNGSFAITFHTYSIKTEGLPNTPTGKGYFRIYWAKFCFQFNGEASVCLNTSDSDKTKWVFEPVTGLKLTSQDGKQLVTLVFELIDSWLSISTDMAGLDDESTSWATDLSLLITDGSDPSTFLLNVPASKLVIGVRAMDIAFSYIPVVYPPKGSLTVAKQQTDQSVKNLKLTKTVDTCEQMGGSSKTVINKGTKEEFGYTITLARDATVDRSPALHHIELLADPTLVGISIRNIVTRNRVRRISANLNLNNQSGSITLDNRDGNLADVGGIMPCTIAVGWSGETSVEPTTILKGFITNQGTTKHSSQSTADFQLIGSDMIVSDAVSFNLPIYDGWDGGEAVDDMLTRSGWQGGRNIQQGDFQLPVSGIASAIFRFPNGAPIMNCIQDVAGQAGYWAFVDNFGVFNYIEMTAGYGDTLGTFREVPHVAAYDEWLSLSGVKDSTNARNALMVIGANEEYTAGIAVVRKDEEGEIGNYLGDTMIPWLRWHVYQDPKINTQEAAEKRAEQMWQNNNRLRLSLTGSVWGHPKFVPWSKLSIQLQKDDIGIPGGAQWRILDAHHQLDADHGTYVCNLGVEYVDNRYSYASWFE